ncbi:MAG: hypothetical protein OXC62_13770 [Aestuariivita sp.]|nr:hypothetical protein [Aestuariivita sp.]
MVLVTGLASASSTFAAPPPIVGTAAWLDHIERTFVQSSGQKITINFTGVIKTGIFYAPLEQFWALNGH